MPASVPAILRDLPLEHIIGGPLEAAIVWPSLLAGCCLVATLIRPDFGADSPSHYVYLRSAYFDRDLDFANEWEAWGFPARKPTATHHQPNLHPIGPAILWTPFFVLADAYVLVDRALEGPRLSRDGQSDRGLDRTVTPRS